VKIVHRLITRYWNPCRINDRQLFNSRCARVAWVADAGAETWSDWLERYNGGFPPQPHWLLLSADQLTPDDRLVTCLQCLTAKEYSND
jgi:hypothetical protein